ncbi:hypothetical protein LB504_010041 [Fusarium proliferatum]|nr:hypothetical protein LB504_010041 [Fusarium proliferatum]
MADIAAPDSDISLNDQSLTFSPDMQIDLADNRVNNDRCETVITQSEHPLNAEHNKERAEYITAELPIR